MDTRIHTTILLLMLTMSVGCERDDARLARMASEAADRQAEQNREMARLNRDVAEGTKRLVESDAQMREALLAAQRDLQVQREQIDSARDALESERREWARRRRTESVYAPILATLGAALLALLPLGLCWQLLQGLARSNEQHIGELLIEDWLAEQPRILPSRNERPSPPAVEHREDDRLADVGSDEPPPF